MLATVRTAVNYCTLSSIAGGRERIAFARRASESRSPARLDEGNVDRRTVTDTCPRGDGYSPPTPAVPSPRPFGKVMNYRLRKMVNAKQWHAGDPLIPGMREEYRAAKVSWLLVQGGELIVGRVNDGDWIVDFRDGTLRAFPADVFEGLFEKLEADDGDAD